MSPRESHASVRKPGLLAEFVRYLFDGLRVFGRAKQTIAAAAERDLPLSWFAAILCGLAFVSSLGSFAIVNLPGAPAIFGEDPLSPITVVWAFATSIATTLVSCAVTFGAIRFVGGKGSLRRYLSAALVIDAFSTWTFPIPLVLEYFQNSGYPSLDAVVLALNVVLFILLINLAACSISLGGLLELPAAFAIVFSLMILVIIGAYLYFAFDLGVGSGLRAIVGAA